MATFEVTPTIENNPYSAVIGSTSNFREGEIRIEPPFMPSADYFVSFGELTGVHIQHFLTGQEATLLGYELPDTGDKVLNQGRIEGQILSVIDDLGKVSSKEIFRKYQQG